MFFVGQWVRWKKEDRLGWITKVDVYGGSEKIQVRLVGMKYSSAINKGELEDYEAILPEVKRELIDDALDAKARDWFYYLGVKS